MLWTLLAVGLPIALAAYAAVTLTRARRSQRARSEERAAALMLGLQGNPAAPPGAPSAVADATPASAAVPPHAAAAAATLPGLGRARLLSDAQRLLYLLVRSALPDHLVLANMRAIDLLDLPAGPEVLGADPRLRVLLHQRLDCVVCRSDWTPLAALVVDAGPAATGTTEAMLRELGIRYLHFRSDSLPRRAAMRVLVLG